MSQNQLRGEKKELQYRKTGVVGVRQNNNSDYQQRPTSGGTGTAPPLSSNAPASCSFKKPNNGQAGQSRGHSGPVNSSSDPNPSTVVRPVENGSHVQSGVSHKPSPAAITKPADAPSQKSSQPVPKAPLSQTSSMTSDSTLPTTPAKGDAGKGYSLQFGSISPGFVTVMQVPARTNSAPPNMNEQQRNQAFCTATRAPPANPVPSVPKQEMDNLDGSTEKPPPQDARTILKVSRDGPVISAPQPPAQAQKPTVIPGSGISMPIQFTQPTGPMQFGGPNTQIPPQGMRPNSHQMPYQMPYGGSNSQIPNLVQPPVFVPGVPHHIMPNRGILHQGPSFGFNPQLTHQLPNQPGNVGMNMPPQINQQAGNFCSARKTVKITHPETHEELKLDDKNGGSPRSRVTHIAHPQSQPIPPYTVARPGGFYPNSYTSSSPFIPPPNSLPLTNSSIAPRFNYSGQGGPAVPYVNQGAPRVRPSAPTVTVKPVSVSRVDSNDIVKADNTSVSVPATEATVGTKDLKVNPASSSPPLKSRFESSKQSDVLVPTSTNTVVDKESVIDVDTSRGMQGQSGQKGYIQMTAQGHGEVSKVATLESTSAKSTLSRPKSKVGVLDVAPHPSANADAKLSGIEDKSTKNQQATEDDNVLQSVSKVKGETNHSEGFQSDHILKAEQPDEVKKSDHEAGLLEASQVEATTASDTGKTYNSDNLVSKKDSVKCKDIVADIFHVSGIDKTPPSANLLEKTVECEVEITENGRPSSSSGIVSGSNKLSVEPNKTKNNKVKKKRKEMFQKAEALGTNPDLYMAYKGSKENKETVVAEESVPDQNMKKVSGAKLENGLVKTKDEQNKPELEDWEDVADGSTPKLESSENVKRRAFHQDDDGGTVKKYSRDFLLTISDQCTHLPEGFEITPEISDVFTRLNKDSRDYSGTGRNTDRPSGAARHDRRGNGSTDANRWAKPNPHLSNRDPGIDLAYASNNMMGFRPGPGANYGGVRPRGQGPVQHAGAGGILPGLMNSMSFQGPHRNNSDGDRWQRATSFNKGLMPSPQPVMHRAENKYEVGKVSDEEQAKQRRLKAILNKLTPQNFEKLFEQVKEVNIDNVVTLTGVISQIFDKALTEPTFCEMYANFCHHLASELPELSVDNQKITFRRLLLNKCQEEFERGEREEEEVNKDEGETKQTEQEKEEKRLKVRRRMLGNIRLIGELYKKKMLTERIMHECIKKLLGHYQNADEENIEALCKLMSTIGEMIDHPKAKEHMDAYFDIMRQLSIDMNLSSRVRFMLKDTIDLRKNRWQQRRKVEGPKKIEEVHRAAAQERHVQTNRLTRGPSMNSATRRAPPLEYAPRGSMMSSSVGGYRGVGPQFRGHVGQDARVDDKSEFENRTISVPLLQRSSGNGPIMLGPQGGLAKGMSGQPSVSTGTAADNSSFHGDTGREVGGLNGFSNTSDRGAGAYVSRGDQFPKHEGPIAGDHSSTQDRSSNATQKMDPYPEERLREMSMAAIKEYYSAKDVKEAELCIKELNTPSYYPTVVSMWVTDSFERKDMERNVLTKLLVTLTKPQESTFSPEQLLQGFESLLTDFEDTVTDAPRAPEFLGRMFGTFVLENVIPLPDVCRLIYQGGEEPGRLLEVGLAADVLGNILETIKSEKGDATLNEIRTSSNLRLEDYLPPKPLKSKKLEMFL